MGTISIIDLKFDFERVFAFKFFIEAKNIDKQNLSIVFLDLL